MRPIAAPAQTLIALATFFVTPSVALALQGDDKLEILPSDGASSDRFGHSVDVSGSTLIVSSLYDDDRGTSSGSAYLFDSQTGLLLSKLTASDGAAYDLFGDSVAIDGDVAIVGASADDDQGLGSGAAYLFSSPSGQQITKLLPGHGEAGDAFGSAVAISGNVAVIGSPNDQVGHYTTGSAYVFTKVRGDWIQTGKLVASDGDTGDHFGASVAIDGHTIVVGAPYHDSEDGACDGQYNHGAAYVFDLRTGSQTAKLHPNECANGDEFGNAVAVSGNLALVAAQHDDWEDGEDDPNSDRGTVYVFDTSSGQQIARLRALDGQDRDYFGTSVAIAGSKAVVGAPGDDDNGSGSGSIYVFDAQSGQQLSKLLPGDGAAGDSLGDSLAIDGSTIVSGATKDDDRANDCGAAYVFATCEVRFESFGVGLSGSGGLVPRISGSGDSCDPNGHWVHFRDGLGGASGLLWIGTNQTDIPFFGGRFYIDFASWWIVIPLSLAGPAGVPGAGFLDIPGGDVNGIPGWTLNMQATFLDPGAVQGVSLTGGLALHVDG